MERLYGIREGRPEKLPQNAVVLTQEDLAAKLGMSVDALQRYKALADMIPELDDMVRDGKVSKTTALAIMKQLVNSLPVEKIWCHRRHKNRNI